MTRTAIILTILAAMVLLAPAAFADDPQPTLEVTQSTFLTVVTGTVYDGTADDPLSNPVGSGVPVDVYCVHDNETILLQSTQTNDDGFFTAYTYNFPTKQCVPGDEAWAEATYNGEVWQGRTVTIVTQGNSDEGEFGSGDSDVAAGVPEFGTIGMTLAVLGATAGLLYMRRRD